MNKNLKVGDTVIVIAGKDKGKKGKILGFENERSRVVVEGVNIVTKHVKPNANNQNGEIVKVEKGIHCSNVAHIDPKDGSATRVKKSVDKKGNKVRISKKSDQVIK